MRAIAYPRRVFHAVGIDLGQAQDNSALAAIRYARPLEDLGPEVPGDVGLPDAGLPVWECRAMKRWPLQTPYTRIALDVANIMATKTRGALVFVDATGVGRPCVEMIVRALAAVGSPFWKLVPVIITGGLAVADNPDGTMHVSKTRLVSVLQVVLQARRLKIAKRHPEAASLRREMGSFKLRVTTSGAETFGAQGKSHDDLVFALALAVYAAEMALTRSF